MYYWYIAFIVYNVFLLHASETWQRLETSKKHNNCFSHVMYLCAFSWGLGEEKILYVRNCLSITILVRFSSLLFVRLVREPVFDFPSLSAYRYWNLKKENAINSNEITGIHYKYSWRVMGGRYQLHSVVKINLFNNLQTTIFSKIQYA